MDGIGVSGIRASEWLGRWSRHQGGREAGQDGQLSGSRGWTDGSAIQFPFPPSSGVDIRPQSGIAGFTVRVSRKERHLVRAPVQPRVLLRRIRLTLEGAGQRSGVLVGDNVLEPGMILG